MGIGIGAPVPPCSPGALPDSRLPPFWAVAPMPMPPPPFLLVAFLEWALTQGGKGPFDDIHSTFSAVPAF